MSLLLWLAIGCGGESGGESSEGNEAVELLVEGGQSPSAEREIPAGVDVKVDGSSVGSTSQGALPPIVLPERQARTPYPVVADGKIEAALRALKKLVSQETSDPDNPWAIAHGLLAIGQEHVLSTGESAVDALFARYAVGAEREGLPVIAFPARGKSSDGKTIAVEPHTDMMMKVLAEIGVRLDTSVQVEGHPHQIGELYYDTVLSTYLDAAKNKSSYSTPNDMPWGLQAIATYAPVDANWEAQGLSMTLNGLTTFLVRVLTKESEALFMQMRQNQPFRKDNRGVFSYTCGGAHLLQGSAYLVGKGFGQGSDLKLVQAQVPLLFWRFPRELALYDRAIEQLPKQKLVIKVQQLKFVGHWLESINKMAAMQIFEPNDAQRAAMSEAILVLVETAKDLKKLGAFDNLEVLRKGNEQLYLDIVGDSAHAVRGLELALGRATIAY